MRRALALVLLLSATALAQNGPNVRAGKARIGYLDELDAGWLPVSVPLENLGNETKVKLVATVHGNGADFWTSEKTVALPPRSKRVEALYVRVAEGATTVEIEVTCEGRRLADSNRGINWRTNSSRGMRRDPPVPLHALLVREGPQDRSLLQWLEPPPVQNNLPPVTLTSEQVEPRELPDRPEGYDGIDTVCLSVTSARDLDEPRRRSLFAWLRNGGRVILLPGPDPAWFRDELVKALLPADAETGEVECRRLVNLEKVVPGGSHETPSARMYTVRSTRHGIRVGGETVNGKRVPYFTLFRYGSGDVIFTAFDLSSEPFTVWPHSREELGRLLHAAIEPVPDRRHVADDERLSPWFEQALQEGELPPPFMLIPVVLLYIVCIGPLNQRLVRRASSPVVSVATIPAISLVFTVVTFFAGYFWRGSSTSLDRLSVIEAHPGEELAREWAALRMRSASSTSYAIVADPLLVASPRSWRETRSSSDNTTEVTRTVQDGGRFAFADVPLNLWERAFFQARGPCPLGGAVTIDVTPQRIAIKNHTRLDLGPGVVFPPGKEGFRVPALAPGGEHVVDGTMAASVKPDRGEVLSVLLEGTSEQKVATRSLDTFLGQLKLETTYVATVKNGAPSFEVAGRGHPDRDLCVLIVQGEDQARDEEIFRYAMNVRDQRFREEYEEVIAMLSAIPPGSRWHRDAQSLKAFIGTARYVDSAQDAYEQGDIEKAHAMVLQVLELPELDRDGVREIRARLDQWLEVVRGLESAAGTICESNGLSKAQSLWKLVVQRETADDVWRRAAQDRLTACETARRLDADDGAEHGREALAEGKWAEALISFEQVRERGSSKEALDTIGTIVAEAEKTQRLAGKAGALPKTAFGRLQAREILLILATFLPRDDPMRRTAKRLLDALERK